MGYECISCQAPIVKVRETRGACVITRVDTHAAHRASKWPVSRSPRSVRISKARGEHRQGLLRPYLRTSVGILWQTALSLACPKGLEPLTF